MPGGMCEVLARTLSPTRRASIGSPTSTASRRRSRRGFPVRALPGDPGIARWFCDVCRPVDSRTIRSPKTRRQHELPQELPHPPPWRPPQPLEHPPQADWQQLVWQQLVWQQPDWPQPQLEPQPQSQQLRRHRRADAESANTRPTVSNTATVSRVLLITCFFFL